MRRRISMLLTAIGLVLAGLTSSAPAWAREDLANGWSPSALEINQLPGYCQDFFMKNLTAYNAVVGGCDGVHHLCAGKVVMNRIMNVSIPKRERQWMLGQAKIEVNYLASRLTPSCKFHQEVRAAESQIKVLEVMLK